MKILLKKGKQKELISLAKQSKTWDELSMMIGRSKNYLSGDIRNEKVLISESDYYTLCKVANKSFDYFIIKKLDNNWGRSKGGNSSLGNTKKFIEPDESEQLAELFGIILGDGHVEKIISGSKTRCYSITITGDSRYDLNYLKYYVSKLFKDLFYEKGITHLRKKGNVLDIKIYGKYLIAFIEKKGIKNGNKKKNNQSIPKWILNNEEYLKNCLRGLIDTDGCVYYISKNNRNLRISFTSYIPNLINCVRSSFVKLGFHPSKIIRGKEIYLTSKCDVGKFIKEIGFSNDKHLKRIQNLMKQAPVI